MRPMGWGRLEKEEREKVLELCVLCAVCKKGGHG